MNFEVIGLENKSEKQKSDSNWLNKDLVIESMILFINKSIWEILDEKDLPRVKTILSFIDNGLKFENFVNRFPKNSFNEFQKKSFIEFLANIWKFSTILKFCDYYRYDYTKIDNSYFLNGFKNLLKNKNLENYYLDFLEDIISTETCINTWIIIRWMDYNDESDLFKEYKKNKANDFLDLELRAFKQKVIVEKKVIDKKIDFEKSKNKIQANLLTWNFENNAFVTIFVDSDHKFKSIVYQEKTLFNSSICSNNIEIFSDKYEYLKRLDELWEEYSTNSEDIPYGIWSFKTTWIHRKSPNFNYPKASNDEYYTQKIAA